MIEITVQMILPFLSERGNLEVDLAVNKFLVEQYRTENEQLKNQQVPTPDLSIMKNSHT